MLVQLDFLFNLINYIFFIFNKKLSLLIIRVRQTLYFKINTIAKRFSLYESRQQYHSNVRNRITFTYFSSLVE